MHEHGTIYAAHIILSIKISALRKADPDTPPCLMEYNRSACGETGAVTMTYRPNSAQGLPWHTGGNGKISRSLAVMDRC
jgi:hypothetical protein